MKFSLWNKKNIILNLSIFYALIGTLRLLDVLKVHFIIYNFSNKNYERDCSPILHLDIRWIFPLKYFCFTLYKYIYYITERQSTRFLNNIFLLIITILLTVCPSRFAAMYTVCTCLESVECMLVGNKSDLHLSRQISRLVQCMSCYRHSEYSYETMFLYE